MSTITIKLELTKRQASALRGALQVMHRQRLQDEFWSERYRYIPHKMRTGHIVACCPDLAAGVKLITAINLAERDSARGAV